MQQWRLEIPPCPPAAVARLRSELSISAALAQVLVRRGLEEPARAGAFLACTEAHPASAFAGLGDALTTIGAHLGAASRITVHGDYDVDGVCSTAVLARSGRYQSTSAPSARSARTSTAVEHTPSTS